MWLFFVLVHLRGFSFYRCYSIWHASLCWTKVFYLWKVEDLIAKWISKFDFCETCMWSHSRVNRTNDHIPTGCCEAANASMLCWGFLYLEKNHYTTNSLVDKYCRVFQNWPDHFFLVQNWLRVFTLFKFENLGVFWSLS